jgi:hypothetical protein
MPNTLQDFLAVATHKASTELMEAFLRVPEDKRTWKSEGTARATLDQLAECALLNGYAADLIQSRKWTMNNFDIFRQEKAEAEALGWEHLRELLEKNTSRVADAIRAVPDDALDSEIETTGGKMPLSEIAARSYWNMTYHLGQINYIAAMLA